MGFWHSLFPLSCCTPPHVVYSNFHESSTPAVYEAGEVPEIRPRTFHTRVGCVAVFHKTTITRNIVQTTCNGIIFSGVQLLIGCVEVAVLLVRSGSPVAGRQRIRFVGDRARGAGVHAAVKVAQAISLVVELRYLQDYLYDALFTGKCAELSAELSLG